MVQGFGNASFASAADLFKRALGEAEVVFAVGCLQDFVETILEEVALCPEKRWQSVLTDLFESLSLSLSPSPFIFLSTYLPIYLSIYLSVDAKLKK